MQKGICFLFFSWPVVIDLFLWSWILLQMPKYHIHICCSQNSMYTLCTMEEQWIVPGQKLHLWIFWTGNPSILGYRFQWISVCDKNTDRDGDVLKINFFIHKFSFPEDCREFCVWQASELWGSCRAPVLCVIIISEVLGRKVIFFCTIGYLLDSRYYLFQLMLGCLSASSL